MGAQLTLSRTASPLIAGALPALQRCSLFGVSVHGNALITCLAAAGNLQELSITDCTFDEDMLLHFRDLTESKSLTSLTTQGIVGKHLPKLPPNVTALDVSDGDAHWASLLTREAAHNMQRLSMTWGETTSPRSADCLFFRSWPVLSVLNIPNAELVQTQFDLLLHAAPSLRTVTVANIKLTEDRSEEACSWACLAISGTVPGHSVRRLVAYLPLKGLQFFYGRHIMDSWLDVTYISDSIEHTAQLVAAGASNLASSLSGRSFLERETVKMRFVAVDDNDSEEDDDEQVEAVSNLAAPVLAALAPLGQCGLSRLHVELATVLNSNQVRALDTSLGNCLTRLSICDRLSPSPSALLALCSALPNLSELVISTTFTNACDPLNITAFCLKVGASLPFQQLHVMQSSLFICMCSH